ncbi:putative kinesin-like motor protein C20orf23, partial [Operophtera brumata]
MIFSLDREILGKSVTALQASVPERELKSDKDRIPVVEIVDDHTVTITNTKVFETIGREVIARVSQGCSACVMAYGQSATGKTHTMMGTDTQPGLVPRLCRALADIRPIELTV